ncbi:hypothetical protein B0A50_05442 [Salinomyces thailandicus]|uniref:Uncharacterized protein n=1 Tax=Salinomyces thailandicus TaxID=706561 RepID=A0A4U0TTI6_9PEZI|nr:hypothetical protein B0A50_05442 [Salinomyces thailandica]
MDLPDSVVATFCTLQTQIGALQQDLSDQVEVLKRENGQLAKRSGELQNVVTARDRRIQELEEHNSRLLQNITALTTELRSVASDRRESAAAASLASAAPLGSHDTLSRRHRFGPLPGRDTTAIATARRLSATHDSMHGFTVVALDAKSLSKPQAVRDDGRELWELASTWKPSRAVAVDMRPVRVWRCSISAVEVGDTRLKPLLDVEGGGGVQGSQQKFQQPPSSVAQDQKQPLLRHHSLGNTMKHLSTGNATEVDASRKRSLPPRHSDSEYFRRKSICVACWATHGWCDFDG